MKELARDALLYQIVFDSSLAGFFVVDVDGIICKVNPADEHIFGYGVGELLHKKIEVIFSKGYKNEYKIRIKKTASESVKILGLRKDGSVFSVDIRIAQRLFMAKPLPQFIASLPTLRSSRAIENFALWSTTYRVSYNAAKMTGIGRWITSAKVASG